MPEHKDKPLATVLPFQLKNLCPEICTEETMRNSAQALTAYLRHQQEPIYSLESIRERLKLNEEEHHE